jgi:hypothetical protein
MRKSPPSIPQPHAAQWLSNAYADGWWFAVDIPRATIGHLRWEAWARSEPYTVADLREWHRDLCWDIEYAQRQMPGFGRLKQQFDAHADGGWFVVVQDDKCFGPYATRKEAAAHVEEGARIEYRPSAAVLWDSFDQGAADAIEAGLAEFADADYLGGDQ